MSVKLDVIETRLNDFIKLHFLVKITNIVMCSTVSVESVCHVIVRPHRDLYIAVTDCSRQLSVQLFIFFRHVKTSVIPTVDTCRLIIRALVFPQQILPNSVAQFVKFHRIP